jgi:hypothetical protein
VPHLAPPANKKYSSKEIYYNEASEQRIFNAKFKKIGLVIPQDDVLTQTKLSRGEIMKRVLQTPVETLTCGFEFPRNHKFYESFNRKIQQITEAGITNHHKERDKKYLDPKSYEKPLKPHKKYFETTWRKSFVNEPQVLTFSDLEFGFVVWLGSLILPLIAFIIECLVGLVNVLLFKRILSVYFERKKCRALSFVVVVKVEKSSNLVLKENDFSVTKDLENITKDENDIETIILEE